MTIKEALLKLDPENDEHWTQDGLPKLDALSEIFGEKVTRKEATEADPDFIRPTNEEEDEEDDSDDEDDESEDDDSEDEASDEDEGDDEDEDEDDDSEDEDDDPDELAEVSASMEKKKVEMEEADKAAADAKKAAEARTKEYLALNEKKKKLTPVNSNQSEIQRYLKTQKAVSQQKAQRRNTVLKHIDQKDINPKSKLDQAMGRKTARGTHRPNFQQ